MISFDNFKNIIQHVIPDCEKTVLLKCQYPVYFFVLNAIPEHFEKCVSAPILNNECGS